MNGTKGFLSRYFALNSQMIWLPTYPHLGSLISHNMRELLCVWCMNHFEKLQIKNRSKKVPNTGYLGSCPHCCTPAHCRCSLPHQVSLQPLGAWWCREWSCRSLAPRMQRAKHHWFVPWPAVNLSETGTGMEASSVTVKIVQNHWAAWKFLNLNLFLLEGNHTNALGETMIDGQAPCINIRKCTSLNGYQPYINPFINHSPGITKRGNLDKFTCPQQMGNHRSSAVGWHPGSSNKKRWWSYWKLASSTSMIA